jgi:hypothetical protein
MTASCPTPASYGPPPLCDATTIPYDTSTTLAVTGFEPLGVLSVVLALFLIGALAVAFSAVWAGRANRATTEEAIGRQKAAEDQLANYLARHPESPESVVDRHLMHKQDGGYFGSLDPRIERPKEES